LFEINETFKKENLYNKAIINQIHLHAYLLTYLLINLLTYLLINLLTYLLTYLLHAA